MELLLVEAFGPLARSLRTGLEEEGFCLRIVEDLDKAGALVKSSQFKAILLDLPVDKELAVLQNWRQARITTPVLFLSTPGSSMEKLNEMGLGPGAALTKPFSFDDLLKRLVSLVGNGGANGCVK